MSQVIAPLHELWHLSGADNGHWYPLWSGPGSDLGELTIFAAAIGLYRAHNCQVHGCWRLARHPVGNGTLKVCRLHHPALPDGKITTADVEAAHARHVELRDALDERLHDATRRPLS
jgi:hypothetical protein